MREELKKYENQRGKFRAIFKQFGRKTNWYTQRKETTVLLENILDNRGKIVCDHAWLNLTKQFEKLDLKEGDFIQFHARVKPYMKGYEKDEVDLKFSHPTKVVMLKRKSDFYWKDVEKVVDNV